MLPFSKHSFNGFNTKALMKLEQKQIVQFAADASRLAVAEWEKSCSESVRNWSDMAIMSADLCMDAYKSLSVGRTISHCLETISYVSAITRCKTITGLTQHKLAWLYQQAKPMKIEIPFTPTLQSIAENIAQSRNFEEYYVLLDNLEEERNIQLPRELPLGLSHYVLFSLLK